MCDSLYRPSLAHFLFPAVKEKKCPSAIRLTKSLQRRKKKKKVIIPREIENEDSVAYLLNWACCPSSPTFF
jgi:hypothetical protein